MQRKKKKRLGKQAASLDGEYLRSEPLALLAYRLGRTEQSIRDLHATQSDDEFDRVERFRLWASMQAPAIRTSEGKFLSHLDDAPNAHTLLTLVSRGDEEYCFGVELGAIAADREQIAEEIRLGLLPTGCIPADLRPQSDE